MQEVTVDRRITDRRHARLSGRRSTDKPVSRTCGPACPKCHETGVAWLAGEAEGGWWFVCLSCDHLWDQREIERGSGSAHVFRTFVMWWKTVGGQDPSPAR